MSVSSDSGALSFVERKHNQLMYWDVNNLEFIYRNPKITMVLTGIGVFMVANLVTLGVAAPLGQVASFFAILLSVPTAYLIRCLVNFPETVKGCLSQNWSQQVPTKYTILNIYDWTSRFFSVFGNST